MVERIVNRDLLEYWKVDSSHETEKDRQQSEGDSEFSSPYDKTDWKLLFDKSRLWNRNVRVTLDEVDSIYFKKINLKGDPSLLRVDILLKSGSRISPAFLHISRGHGLKLKNLKPGSRIDPTELTRDPHLQVTVPANPALFQAEESKIQEVTKTIVPVKRESEETTKILRVTKLGFLSLKDPITQKTRPEIVILYSLAFILAALLAVTTWVIL